MALLHYKLALLESNWVLFCEGVPVDAFLSRAKTMNCAKQMIARAHQRGDMAALQMDGFIPEHSTNSYGLGHPAPRYNPKE